jgi:hypothetical protein
MHEKRSMKRFNLELTSSVSLGNPHNGGKWISLMTSNISARGTFLRTRQPFPVGTRVNVEVVLPISEKKAWLNNSLIEISGVVIRNEEAGMALRFDDAYRILSLPETVLH